VLNPTEVLDRIIEEAAKANLSYLEFLDRLLEAEVTGFKERRVEQRIRLARFPYLKTIDGHSQYVPERF